jgi:hypothetical protein
MAEKIAKAPDRCCWRFFAQFETEKIMATRKSFPKNKSPAGLSILAGLPLVSGEASVSTETLDFCVGGSPDDTQSIAETSETVKRDVTALALEPKQAAAHAHQFWLYVAMPSGVERGYLEKPTDRPTLHVWVDHQKHSYTEYVATYDDCESPVAPYGAGWKRARRKPSFMQLRDHRPSTVWCRKVVRS